MNNTNPPTYIQKIEGLSGMLYRLRQVYHLSQILIRPLSVSILEQINPIVIKCLRVAPLESYLIHVRALDDFIRKTNPGEDDLVAIQYLETKNSDDFKKIRSSSILKKKERNAISKQLVHITKAEAKISDWIYYIPKFRDRIINTARKFCEYPEVRKILDEKVDRWKASDYKVVVDCLKWISKGMLTTQSLDQGDLNKKRSNIGYSTLQLGTTHTDVSPNRFSSETDECDQNSGKGEEDKKE